jgi:hypothetical protein
MFVTSASIARNDWQRNPARVALKIMPKLSLNHDSRPSHRDLFST